MGRNGQMKTVAFSAAAVLSTAVILHLSFPTIARFMSSEVPKMYESIISWLTPLYLYFLINVIILSIAAASKFQNVNGSDNLNELVGTVPVIDNEKAEVEEVKDYAVPVEEEEEEEFVIKRSSWTPERRSMSETNNNNIIETETETETVTAPEELLTEYSVLAKEEKPLVSCRLGRRKSLTKSKAKVSPEAARALRVARPKRNDTLESTWKAITDGRAVPLTRHLKKSDTWENSTSSSPKDHAVIRKSETFKERGGGEPCFSPARPRMRKEPSLGQDELNRRVEAFINNFNQQMRMQRQESLNQYLDLIKSSGNHN